MVVVAAASVMLRRDDFVENDQLHPGVIENTLVDGTFAFLSHSLAQMVGDLSAVAGQVLPIWSSNIRKTLVWMQRQPYSGASKDPIKDGHGGGAIFKWSVCGGRGRRVGLDLSGRKHPGH